MSVCEPEPLTHPNPPYPIYYPTNPHPNSHSNPTDSDDEHDTDSSDEDEGGWEFPYEIGEIVEVYWPLEKRWFKVRIIEIPTY